MRLGHVSLRDYRSYRRLELELEPGTTLVVGPNGVGKTNLLEALHVGTQGFSPRTRAERQLIRFGAAAGRVAVRGSCRGVPFDASATLHGRAKDLVLDGVAVSSDELRGRFPVLVFTPDRLAVVKGGPIVRRSYLDRMLGRLRPSQALLPGQYAHALAQRNAALRRVRHAAAPSDAIDPWTEAVALQGLRLDDARMALVQALAPRFSAATARLGLPVAALGYTPSGITRALLDERLGRDLERGVTSIGPHLVDVTIQAEGQDLRSFGSQGQQRLGVLGLVLAEAALLQDELGEPPLLLLDDVLSELDDERRLGLLAELPSGTQALITATGPDALPGGSALAHRVLRVGTGGVVSV